MQFPIRPIACVVVALMCGLPIVAEQPRPTVVARVVKPDDARRKLGLLPNYAVVPGIKNIKVAVLDSGFDGVDGKRPYLPANAVVVEDYDPGFIKRFSLGDPEFQKPLLPGNSHGRLMAQIIWATTGNAPEGPQFYLLNANGPTMFRRAVRYAIEQKVDVILFSGTFEGAGNYDGRGPINVAVDAALAAGIIWVNATGNCGGAVYNGRVDVGPNGFLRFGATQTALRFRNRLDENALTLTLTWNDYQDAEDAGTEKDLDLIVEDSQGRVVGECKLTQVGPGRVAGDGESKNPRERLTLTDLPACEAGQEYRIRIRARAANFGPRDRIRLLLTPVRETPIRDPDTGKMLPAIEFLDATRGGEIYPPADHAGVLAIGDTMFESATGPTADGRVKPDVIVSESVARFSNGEETAGASNAAAYFAGVVAVLRAVDPGLTTGHLRQWVQARDREVLNADIVTRPAAPVVVPELPILPRPGVPLSPNELRALRYSEYALEEKRVRGEASPQVIISTPSGAYVVRSGARLPNDPPFAPAPSGVPGTTSRAQAPIGVGVSPRPTLPHAPWQTPSPRQLSLLLGKP
ncbi:MAG: S8 family serine peptidase [Planctomycetes bacterium]|nr:S8 family serine peptidase [Planctomycetota bacterium]